MFTWYMRAERRLVSISVNFAGEARLCGVAVGRKLQYLVHAEVNNKCLSRIQTFLQQICTDILSVWTL